MSIELAMEKITEMTTIIAAAAEEQHQLADNMSSDINKVGTDVSNVAERANDLAEQSKSLASNSHSLLDIVHQFKV